MWDSAVGKTMDDPVLGGAAIAPAPACLERKFDLRFDVVTTYSLAAQRNAYPLFSNMALHLEADELDEKDKAVNGLQIALECDNTSIPPVTWEIASLAPGQYVRLQDKPVEIPDEYLFALSDEVSLNFEFVL